MATGKKIPTPDDIGKLVQIFDKIYQTLEKYSGKFFTFTKDKARKIRLRLHGKQIAVLGPVAAGKTSLLNVLMDPKVVIDPMNYEKTHDSVPISDGNITIEWKLPLDESGQKPETIKMKVRKPKDVGGEESLRDTKEGWIDICKGSDFVFYLFDANKYEPDGKIGKRLHADFEWIANHAQEFAAGFRIVMFANKMDKISDDDNERTKWASSEIPKIESITRDALGPYKQHLALITPCSLLSNKTRTNAISLALQYLSEMKT